ncbi:MULTISPECIES: heavy metal translocating P-type ATPase [Bacillus]|uniref:heavy metal translocating P-type ATPase n=1 Tax=Bacillus TaxID=1386 RepID=UPI000E2EB3EF|nr:MULTISPECIES: heavy metal translocating P-type ATPase [Bacillus]MCY7498553.1 heavy metal translocating P-type ATPase [Bacillus altitudinis]MCY7537262.1 heavy metal translocating P-type ATPase [Bacillus altitudinis]MCY7547795.1 heavy metal translocating P-type ATPase [Bacillus altitudinis]MCY7555855.1 heavy metal translocating P-type ATPase [Bacillus altitudinis]MCY7590088.1 heavy metal translocating P-type ATPase [Bacillus altitudinis]
MKKEIDFQITGMTCAACAGRIEKGLNRLEGVDAASVNLALETSHIVYETEQLTAEDLKQKIQSLGYDVVMEQAEFDIEGMTCAACANRIEKKVNRMEGIDQGSVNFALETLQVTYHPGQISPSDIKEAVKSIGYSLIEPAEEHAEEGKKDHRQVAIEKQTARFLFSMILSLPLLWAMVSHFSFTSFIWLPEAFMNPWVQLALAAPVQFIVGWPFYVGAYKALKNKSANMDVLVALGTSAAFFYSLYESIQSAVQGTHEAGLYYETSAVLITLIVLGKLMEARAKGRSSEAIQKLMGLQAKEAVIERDGKEMTVPISEVKVNDFVFVKPGEKVPVDGEIIEGTTAIDESMITGESLPVDKTTGDTVIGATINKNGFVKVKATKVGKETALSQIIRVVEQAQGSKAPIQRMADQISGIFVPIVVGLAVLTFLIWFFFVDPGNVTSALETFIAVIVIACPCALGLATPTSIMAGSGRAAESGILFKGGEHLEVTQSLDTVVLDKTGTVTKGEPSLTDVIASANWTEDKLLQLAGSAEQQSEHPLARAITDGMKTRGLQAVEVEAFQADPGHGIEARAAGHELLIGTRKLLKKHHISCEALETVVTELEEQGKTAMLIAIDGEPAGIVAVADTIKSSSSQAVARLKEQGIHVVMMTGDNKRTAEAIASEAGIDHVIAEVLPEEKAAHIVALQKQGKKVAMVGDGINDAPALATANIGMAVGTGTDVAMEAADITLMTGDLHAIADALEFSRKTMRNIKQNLFWALAYNCIGIPIAAFGFLAPWLAGAAMAFSSVSVVLNALRLQRLKPVREGVAE